VLPACPATAHAKELLVKTRNRWIVAMIAVLVLALAACNGDNGNGDDGEAPADGEDLGLEQPGQIRVGSDMDFDPFEFIEDGQPQGFDIDLMNEIAERLDLEVEFVNTSFDTIFTQLASGEFDAIISAITITEDRQQSIDFSEPYFSANQALLVPADSDISSTADLEGVDVGVQAATTGAEYANENFGDATIVEFPTSPAGINALEAGQIDAFFIDLPVASNAAEGSENLELVEEVDTDEDYGIGIQQGNDGLREAINEQLRAIIDDGTYEEIYSTWFDGDPPEQFRQ
jgi:ABC-type amino acid transport substrate-binding protein